ncbi:hypothetical protein [Campylobacter geochelonis]|uniref:Uncharacterized protein conserved in bacteria n=1 Tax=Campylobacter geochelonis TaxID=1780362 RepID=A0A128ER97_9BACT|nr:hypothetical protein [Campylobacter geochelonis]QKF71879.1 hypothetical protein CGEO_1602 [Campylobacter geochelonis]CZE47070.1 Uncharacterized protein conserved in bacteria [Campylobacter geochelonis]CZE47352.1 Uncharacterized protein conserved in bacteria [Campylobacter geochelonis]CZE50985.1 Uncharacterized protein conserved in bacteria [Campylobacter geochelonis]
MAIKDDIKDVQQSIGSEEQFLENIIKSEMFVRKYKKMLIAIFVVLVVVVLGYSLFNYIEDNRFQSAHKAYSELVADPNNQKAKDELKSKDKNLFAIYELRQALDANDTAKIKELASNTALDPILQNIIKFEAGEDSGEMMSAYSAFMKGYTLLKEGKIEAAKSEFAKIPPNSQLSNIARNLRHYNGSKK